MGAHGHSRPQEWMLGGATEDRLAAASRFVLFSHQKPRQRPLSPTAEVCAPGGP